MTVRMGQKKMSETRKRILKEMEGAITEIGANKTLVMRDDYNRGFNAGADAAIEMIRKYMAGKGLFQL